MGTTVSDAANGGAPRHTLVLQNRLDQLRKLTQWINRFFTDHGVPADTAFRIDLVLSEVVTNIISYGYEDEVENGITITMSVTGNAIKVVVLDQGKPFDPLSHPTPSLQENLEEADVGGRGIHLTRNFADECKYRYESDKNILTLIFHISPASPKST